MVYTRTTYSRAGSIMSLKFALKLIAAVGLLALIAVNIDRAAFVEAMAAARPGPLLLALALSFAIALCDAGFWSTMMGGIGCRIGFRAALTFSLAGWFFNNFAPSTVGSDLFRAAQMRRAGAPVGATLRVVVAARLMSFAALLAVIAAGLPFAFRYAAEPAERALFVLVFLAGAAAMAGLVFAGPALGRLLSRARLPRAEKIAVLSDNLAMLAMRHPRALAGWLLAGLPHLLRVGAVWAICAALGAPVDPAALFALVPVSLLVAMIPISFASWGVREASFIYFLGLTGLAPATAFAVSILYGLTRIVMGAAGGAVWVAARAEHYRFDMTGSSGDRRS